MSTTTLQTDKVGITASILCMIHCIATPFIFVAKSCAITCCETSPEWWSALDFLFLLISFFAIHKSSKNTTKKGIKYAMWSSWLFLLAVLLNEKFHLVPLSHYVIYVPAILLVVLHFYNLKNSNCKNNNCYAN